MKENKTAKRLIVAVVLLGVVAAGVIFYLRSNAPVDITAKYKLHEVTQGDVKQTISAEGNVEAADKRSLYVETTQRVSKVHVKVGYMVKAGDLLVEYDIAREKQELLRSLEQAKLSLQNARLVKEGLGLPATGNELLQYQSDVTNAEKSVVDAQNDIKSVEIRITQQQLVVEDAQRTVDNNEILYKSGAKTKYEYDLSITNLKAAEETLNELSIQLENKRRGLDNKQSALDDTKRKLGNATNKSGDTAVINRISQQENMIRLAELDIEAIEDDLAKLTEQTISPVTGVVSRVGVTEGGQAVKTAAVVELSDLSRLVVRADITEYDAPLLSIGQEVEITTAGLPDQVYKGMITKIATEALEKEKSSGKEVVVPIEVSILNADERLKAGYTAELAIILKAARDAVNIPANAVVYANDGTAYVALYEDREAHPCKIETGLVGDRTIEVTNGIGVGSVVILDPADLIVVD